MRFRPAEQVVLTFALLIVSGTLALRYLGLDSHALTQRTWMASAFTSTSAVCVTGLSIIDVSQELNLSGRIILLILIQVGGLGVLTLSNWLLLFVRGQVSLQASMLTWDTLGDVVPTSAASLLRRVMLFTFAAELVGALILLPRFLAVEPPGRAVWLAAFHSVSAFCNAGFALYSDNLVRYRTDPVVNVVVASLIVLGGMGYVVAIDVGGAVVARLRRRPRRHTTLHTRMVLFTSAILILGGGFLIFLGEWRGSALSPSWAQRLLESVFLSISARTAGFNTVDTASLTTWSLMILILLMFIGASPAGTGGGIKTTTAVIVWNLVRSWFRGKDRVEVMDRTIPRELVVKALAVALSQATVAFTALLALQWTEMGRVPSTAGGRLFMDYAFEVTSAIGTVGLSTGVTAALSEPGKAVLIVLMFVGRVGPLVLASSIVGEAHAAHYRYPEEDVLVG